MSTKKEKIKQIALGVIAVVFAVTFYATFFKDKPAPRPVTSRVAPTAPSSSINTKALLNTKPVNQRLPVEKEPNIVFEYPIRDIFKAQFSSSMRGSGTKKDASKPPLTESEIQAIRNKLAFKGTIFSAGRAVAIIDNGFFHVGDTIGSYKVVSISDTNVRIDTLRGIVTLEMIHDE